MKYFLLLFAAFLVSPNLHAQIAWLNDIQNPHANFFTVQKEFSEWEKSHPDTASPSEQYEDISEQYYTWENYWRTHITHDGTLIHDAPAADRKKFLAAATSRSGGSKSTANWQPAKFTAINNIGYLGRIDCIAIDPVDSNTIWVGSPTGGLWKSTNNGVSWSTNTDTLSEIGISDIVIDTKNTAVMYLAMGTRDMPNSNGIYSVGVMKSTNGGNNWQTTGLAWAENAFGQACIKRLIIDPTNDNVLYAALTFDDSSLLFKTTNAGATWSRIFGSGSGGRIDVAFMPGNSSTVYVANVNASGNTMVYTSTNSGSTFTPNTLTTAGGAVSLRLAVTPANANYLYVLTSNQLDFNSLYLSKDGGNTFNLQSDTPNILGYDCSNSPAFGSGQGFYDMTIGVSATNANIVFVGGISMFESQDGGVHWSLNSCWYAGIHADQHYTLFSPYHHDVIYEGNDGGIYKSNDLGNTWNCLNANIVTTQFYGSDASHETDNEFIGGCQDNGTMLIRNDSLLFVAGGDGSRMTFFAKSNSNVFTLVGGSTFAIDNSGNWTYPTKTFYQFNPQNPKTIVSYQNGLYKSYDYGVTWNLVTPKIDTVTSGSLITDFPTGDSSVFFGLMYINYQLYKIDYNTGAATQVTGNLTNFFCTSYCVSNTNTNKIWVIGYDNGPVRLLYTSDGGNTWTDITGSLANQGVGDLVYVNNSNDAIYVSSGYGVYYIDASQTDWIDWSAGLPNAGINELSINYPTGELVGSTYGRGIWETTLYNPTGINQIPDNNAHVSIYPNPNNGNFTVNLQNIKQNTLIEIFNVVGQKIYETNLNSTNMQLNLSEQPKGIYLYRISTTDGQFISSGKVVIE